MKKVLDRILNIPPVRFVADVVRLYFSKKVSRSAAQLSYFLTLTLFPILICISAFVGRINLTTGDVLAQLEHLLPTGVFNLFLDYVGYLDQNRSTAMIVAGIFLTVLFASGAIRGLITIMHELYEEPPIHGLRQLTYSILFALFLLVTVYLSMVVVVTGNWFFHMLSDLLGLSWLMDVFETWQWLRYVLLLGIVFLFILLLYRFAAPVRRLHPPVIPGALLASVALVGASMIFSLFVSHSTQYSLIYGSLASVIIMLVWLYLCGNILILGNVVNCVIYTYRQEKS